MKRIAGKPYETCWPPGNHTRLAGRRPETATDYGSDWILPDADLASPYSPAEQPRDGMCAR